MQFTIIIRGEVKESLRIDSGEGALKTANINSEMKLFRA